ncbi:MAG TPA: hypothetical protein VN999_11220 [Thermoanaerobaculia bacterium]|nr:hypothetical protein [Thermoanaerobaculia bacterium]
MQVQSVSELASRVAQDPQLANEIKQDPVGAIAKIVGPAYINDRWLYRMVVGALGFVALITAIGAIWITLSPNAKGIPDILTALGAGAIGALAGLLAPSPAR